ncbi:MAG: hypothetical protein ACRDYD_03805, partial [Acidimicrobiales bacterium]
ARTVLVRLPLAFLLAAVAIQLVELAVAATDALCSTFLQRTGFDPTQVFHQLWRTTSPPSGPMPGFVVLCIGVLLGLGALALWLELVVRSAAILAATLFLPLALAGLVWPTTSGWARRLAETLAALVLSKLVIVAVLATGTAALLHGRDAGSLSALVAGGALVLMASMAPFAVLRLVPFVEAGAVGHLEGVGRRAARALPAVRSVGALVAGRALVDDGLRSADEPWEVPLGVGEPWPEHILEMVAAARAEPAAASADRQPSTAQDATGGERSGGDGDPDA